MGQDCRDRSHCCFCKFGWCFGLSTQFSHRSFAGGVFSPIYDEMFHTQRLDFFLFLLFFFFFFFFFFGKKKKKKKKKSKKSQKPQQTQTINHSFTNYYTLALVF